MDAPAPRAAPRAAVFDMDGTLVDNMAFHAQAWREMARRLGAEFSAETYERHYAGRKNEELLPLLLGRPLSRDESARLAGEKEAKYRELYRPHMAPLPGLLALLERLEEAGVRRAVATAAPAENRALVLDGLGLAGAFEHVIGAEHAARGKPAPDIYLAAARALELPPSECLAFEDAVNGVRSARAAGMAVVAVLTTSPTEALREAGAEWILRDYSELPADLEALIFARGRLPAAAP